MKGLAVLLFTLFKAAKLGKLALTGGTMLLSIFVYATIWGWKYAAGFVLLLLAHEMGHYLAARRRGLDVGAPTFIPFVGAWIALKDLPHDAETEAYIGLAGPFAGTVATALVLLAARFTGEPWLLAVCYAGFFLNLFNLIPLSPLDGGRITGVISPKVWLLGVPILVGLFFYRPSPMLVLIAILAIPHVWTTLTAKGQPGAYYATSATTRLSYAGKYLALVAILAVLSFDLHEELGQFTSARSSQLGSAAPHRVDANAEASTL